MISTAIVRGEQCPLADQKIFIFKNILTESLFIRFRQAVIQHISEFDETLLKH